jgi:hypothetical protein
VTRTLCLISTLRAACGRVGNRIQQLQPSQTTVFRGRKIRSRRDPIKGLLALAQNRHFVSRE